VTDVGHLPGREAVGDLDFEAIETVTRSAAARIAARAVEARLNADHSDHAGPTMPRRCGEAVRCPDRRPYSVQTVPGDARLERAYCYYARCEGGSCPRERAVGIAATRPASP
jgi:hypothetical protein